MVGIGYIIKPRPENGTPEKGTPEKGTPEEFGG